MLLNIDNCVIFASFCGPPPHKLRKTLRFLKNYTKNLSAPAGTTSILEFLAFWAFISVAFRHVQGAILNAPQEEMLFTYATLQGANLLAPQEEILLNMDHAHKMPPSKEQILMCHKKKCY